jgi:hypothetical protein
LDVDRLADQAVGGIFAIDIVGYAAMSNHAHVVVRIDRNRALGWSVQGVLERWTALFSELLLVNRRIGNPTACEGALAFLGSGSRPRFRAQTVVAIPRAVAKRLF